jgi:enterochelin esterase-like enzyme
MLLSLWFLVTLACAAGVALVGWVLLGIRHYRRRKAGKHVLHGWQLWLARLGATLLTLVLIVATVADAFNRKFSYIPTFAALRGNISPELVKGHQEPPVEVAAGPAFVMPDHGTVEEVQVPGPVSNIGPRRTFVYLPPEYYDPAQRDRHFPVLYLIHGSPGTSADWLRGGYVDRSMDRLLKDKAIEPFIVVLPDVNGGYRRDVECQDVAGGPMAQTYLVKDVVGWVDEHYRTVLDRRGRAIGGLSTGGYCGLNLTFRHQDVYSAAVSHSGYGRPDKNAYTGDLFGGDQALRAANTPDSYLPTIPLHLPIGVYLDAGGTDGDARRGSARLFEVLQSRGVTVTYNVVQGESHDFVAWRQNLRLSLPWVSKWFHAQGAEGGKSMVTAPDTSDLPPPSPTDSVHGARQTPPVDPHAKAPVTGSPKSGGTHAPTTTTSTSTTSTTAGARRT